MKLYQFNSTCVNTLKKDEFKVNYSKVKGIRKHIAKLLMHILEKLGVLDQCYDIKRSTSCEGVEIDYHNLMKEIMKGINNVEDLLGESPGMIIMGSKGYSCLKQEIIVSIPPGLAQRYIDINHRHLLIAGIEVCLVPHFDDVLIIKDFQSMPHIDARRDYMKWDY